MVVFCPGIIIAAPRIAGSSSSDIIVFFALASSKLHISAGSVRDRRVTVALRDSSSLLVSSVYREIYCDKPNKARRRVIVRMLIPIKLVRTDLIDPMESNPLNIVLMHWGIFCPDLHEKLVFLQLSWEGEKNSEQA